MWVPNPNPAGSILSATVFEAMMPIARFAPFDTSFQACPDMFCNMNPEKEPHFLIPFDS
jgi:hypothetical protein